MPAKSQAQREFVYAKFGKAWAQKHHFDNEGPLPAKVGGTKKSVSGAKKKAAPRVQAPKKRK